MSLDDIMATPERPKGPTKEITAVTRYSPGPTSVYSAGTKRRVGDVFLDKDTETGLDYLAVQTHHGPMPYDAYGMESMWD